MKTAPVQRNHRGRKTHNQRGDYTAMKFSAQQITLALGGHWHGQYGTARCPCHDDQTASLKISEKPDPKRGGTRIDCHCFAKCSWLDIKAELVKRGLLDAWRPTSLQVRHKISREANAAAKIAELRMYDKAQKDAAEDLKRRVAQAMKFWNKAVPLDGTLGGSYLRVHRGLEFIDGAFDHCLRWHKAKNMIVGLMSDPRTGLSCGVQRIFLDELGRKVDRKMLGKAGVCFISPDDEVTQGLHIVEGIEDAIACYIEGARPVWAALSAGMIEKFPLLPGVDCLMIFPDPDDTGKDAAAECAATWMEDDREVRILPLRRRPA